MSSPISSSPTPSSHEPSSAISSTQESIYQFYKVISIELPIGGNDSINRINSVYEIIKKKIPDYKYDDLDNLFELRNNGKSFTTEYAKLREKIYDFCKEELEKNQH